MLKGLAAISEAGAKGASYIKLENGKSVVIRILIPADEIPARWEHTEQFGGQWKTVTCAGRNGCPLCAAGKNASLRAYIPVLDTSDNKVKVFKASKKTITALLAQVEEYGDLTARNFKVLRQGATTDTVYQFFARDPEPMSFDGLELPDLAEIIAPVTAESIRELMNGSNGSGNGGATPPDDDLPF